MNSRDDFINMSQESESDTSYSSSEEEEEIQLLSNYHKRGIRDSYFSKNAPSLDKDKGDENIDIGLLSRFRLSAKDSSKSRANDDRKADRLERVKSDSLDDEVSG